MIDRDLAQAESCASYDTNWMKGQQRLAGGPPTDSD
jgi:hypothetical protein